MASALPTPLPSGPDRHGRAIAARSAFRLPPSAFAPHLVDHPADFARRTPRLPRRLHARHADAVPAVCDANFPLERSVQRRARQHRRLHEERHHCVLFAYQRQPGILQHAGVGQWDFAKHSRWFDQKISDPAGRHDRLSIHHAHGAQAGLLHRAHSCHSPWCFFCVAVSSPTVGRRYRRSSLFWHRW